MPPNYAASRAQRRWHLTQRTAFLKRRRPRPIACLRALSPAKTKRPFSPLDEHRSRRIGWSGICPFVWSRRQWNPPSVPLRPLSFNFAQPMATLLVPTTRFNSFFRSGEYPPHLEKKGKLWKCRLEMSFFFFFFFSSRPIAFSFFFFCRGRFLSYCAVTRQKRTPDLH